MYYSPARAYVYAVHIIIISVWHVCYCSLSSLLLLQLCWKSFTLIFSYTFFCSFQYASYVILYVLYSDRRNVDECSIIILCCARQSDEMCFVHHRCWIEWFLLQSVVGSFFDLRFFFFSLLFRLSSVCLYYRAHQKDLASVSKPKRRDGNRI